MITEVPIHLIEPEWRYDKWIRWLDDEIKNTRLRFGNDSEALQYFPDDYYHKMELWWSSDKRIVEPIELVQVGNIYRIYDGWHRVAISHKIKLETIPSTILVGKK